MQIDSSVSFFLDPTILKHIFYKHNIWFSANLVAFPTPSLNRVFGLCHFLSQKLDITYLGRKRELPQSQFLFYFFIHVFLTRCLSTWSLHSRSLGLSPLFTYSGLCCFSLLTWLILTLPAMLSFSLLVTKTPLVLRPSPHVLSFIKTKKKSMIMQGRNNYLVSLNAFIHCIFPYRSETCSRLPCNSSHY